MKNKKKKAKVSPAKKDRSGKMKKSSMTPSKKTDIAIIGAGLLFPAKIESLADLWDFMMQRKNAAVAVPENRWSLKRFYSKAPQAPGKTYMSRGNFINRPIDAFDSAVFGLSPREASLLDPLQRHILFAAWRALEDAKITVRDMSGTNTGVFVGAFLDDFLLYAGRSEMRTQIQDHFSAVSATAGMVSARLGHVLNLHGPLMSIDTACSSSMTAIVQACDALAAGQCEMAFAGGSSYMLLPEPSITMSKAGFLSQDGCSKSFSEAADGYGRGEGAGILLLKPLSKALEDRDPIHAVICGGALNQDGKTAALPVPSRKAQGRLMTALLEKTGIAPEEISAIEAHGAGTPVGDPVEAGAIGDAIAQKRPTQALPLLIGSVKANIGHLEASAGVAGVMRAMLCLEHQKVPPWPCTGETASFLEKSGLFLPKKSRKLPVSSKAKSAYILVNSFGYGGGNAALLLRSAPKQRALRGSGKRLSSKPESFLLLSAATWPALRKQAENYADFLENYAKNQPEKGRQEEFFMEVAENILSQRDLLPCRLVLLKKNTSLLEMADTLRRFAALEKKEDMPEISGLFAGRAEEVSEQKRSFCICFGGQPALALREDAPFLLSLPEKLTPKSCAFLKAYKRLIPEAEGRASILEELRLQGKFSPLSPVSSFLLQLLAAEYCCAFGLSAGGAVQKGQENTVAASVAVSYFEGEITPLQALKNLQKEKGAFASQKNVSEALFSLGLLVGSGISQQGFSVLKRKMPLAESLAETMALALAAGAFMQRKEKRVRTLCLPPYPLGLEDIPGPERLAGRRDRLDLTCHPILGTKTETAEKSWEADLTTGFLPWLGDHALERQKAGADWLFPFAGFVEASLAAHEQIFGEKPCILEKILFKTPLFPARDLTTKICFSYQPEGKKLFLQSWTPIGMGAETPFLPHGSVEIKESLPWKQPYSFPEERCSGAQMEKIDPAVLYQNFRRAGLFYGPCFRSVASLCRSGTGAGAVALSEISLPPAALEDTEQRYLLHPVLLDGVFQTGACLLPETAQRLYAPYEMAQFRFHGALPESEASRRLVKLKAVLRLREFSDNFLIFDGEFYTANGNLLGEIIGLECRALENQKEIELLEIKRETLPPLPLLVSAQRFYVFGDPDDVARKALKKLSENGRKIFFKEISEAEMLFATGKEQPLSVVYFPQRPKGKETDPAAFITEQCLTLKKILTHVPSTRQFTLTLVMNSACGAVAEETLEKGEADAFSGLLNESLLGFIRAAQVEYPGFSFRTVFYPAGTPSCISALAAELALEEGAETEMYLSEAGRQAPRLSALKPEIFFAPQKGEDAKRADNKRKKAFFLIQNEQGQKFLQGLGWEARLLPPLSRDQVRVKTLAAGLNFKDFLNVMGLIPAAFLRHTHTNGILGMESLVEIVQCGEAVKNFQKGNLCLCFVPGTFASERILEADNPLLFPLPAFLTEKMPLEALKALAGFSVAALTAGYCLLKLARLEKGETVLIHSAAGGVGQMALQIAQMKGARIFATAGSESRRKFLAEQENVEGVFDSHSLAFSDGILNATKGKGVDVALNCLTGEALQATLKLMAPFGRFVEIGKKDIIENTGLGLESFNQNLAFFSFDLDRLMASRLETVAEDFAQFCQMLAVGELHPPRSHFFPMEKVQEAFRHFTSPDHAGRILIDFTSSARPETEPAFPYRETPKNALFEDQESAYLVTGGTRGFGLETVRFLLENGARSLHVIARKDPKGDPDWLAVQEKAQRCGAVLSFHQADIAEAEKIAEILKTISEGQKLKHIFHAAGQAQDELISDLSPEALKAVLRPKVAGALTLWQGCERHNITLDHFILYSSLAGLTGNAGQAAYGAANVFLDQFACFLREKGVRALSVGWGAVAQGGMMRQKTVAALFRQSGIWQMESDLALEKMTFLLTRKKGWGGVAAVSWPVFFKQLPSVGREARFGALREKFSETQAGALANLPKAEHQPFILKVILEEISAILQLETGGVSARTPLESLGLDSLAAMELQLAVQKRLGLELPVSLLTAARTPFMLAAKIAERAETLALFSEAGASAQETGAAVEKEAFQGGENA